MIWSQTCGRRGACRNHRGQLQMNRILITGAAGSIGRALREGFRGRYPLVRLSDIAPMEPARSGEEVVPADLASFAEVDAAMKGVDAVVHLGGISVEDTWDKI